MSMIRKTSTEDEHNSMGKDVWSGRNDAIRIPCAL